MTYKKTLLTLFFCTSAYGANVLFQEEVDDFTDEMRISLVFFEDSDSNFLERKIIAQCDKGNLVLAIQNGIFFSMSNNLNVKMRFDKNTPFENRFIYKNNLVASIDKDIVSNFLNNAKTANNLVIKIEDNDHTMRFTEYGKNQNQIIQFIEKVQSIAGCGLS